MSRSYPHVRRTTARAPPAIPPRPWVGSRPVCRHACSRQIRAEVACRTATQQGYLQVAAALRCVREFVSQFAALPRGPWLQPARARPHLASLPPLNTQSPAYGRPSSLFLDGRGARSFNADERLLLQEKGRMLIPGRESAHGSKVPARENVGLVALRRLTCV
jgi:hypothetical protein